MNDLGAVIALGLIFAPFTLRTVIFVAISIVAFILPPFLTPRFFRKYGGRVSEFEAKYLLLLLFGLGGLATWAGSEAVLPAYIIGMVLAQYSFLVATVIGTAIIPTAIANAYFSPRHLLRRAPKAIPSAEDILVQEDLQEMP